MQAHGATDEDTAIPDTAGPATPPEPEPPRDLAAVIGHADRLAGESRLHEAIQIYRNVLRHQPRLLGLHFNLGVALLRHERPQEAVGHFGTVVDAGDSPDWLRLRARQALGLALEQSGESAAAAAEYRRLLVAEPGNFGVLRQLATLYRDLGLPERALEAFQRCHALWPRHCGIALEAHALRHAVGDWGQAPDAAAQAALLSACTAPPEGVEPPPPHALLLPPFTLTQAQVAPVARAHARYIEQLSAGPVAPPVRQARAGRRLRLAYAACEVHGPASAWVRSFMRQHDRDRYEVCLYTWGADDHTAEREQAQRDADTAADLSGWSDAAIAARLRADGVDVLLDPGTSGRRARHGLFARRTAPMQLAWLADAVSAWSGWFDALITDAAQSGPVDPAAPGGFASPLWTIPHARLAPPSMAGRPATPTRAGLGLPERAPVLGLLGEPAGLDPAFVAMSLRLVDTVPGAVLWLRDVSPLARERLRARAVASGVSAERLVFTKVEGLHGTALPALLQCCDLVLDPGRDEASTSVGAALAAGVPVLSLRAPHALQRGAAGWLEGAGAAEAVLHDLAAYEARARHLLRQPRRLLAWRRELQQRTTHADPAMPLPCVQALQDHIERHWAEQPRG